MEYYQNKVQLSKQGWAQLGYKEVIQLEEKRLEQILQLRNELLLINLKSILSLMEIPVNNPPYPYLKLLLAKMLHREFSKILTILLKKLPIQLLIFSWKALELQRLILLCF